MNPTNPPLRAETIPGLYRETVDQLEAVAEHHPNVIPTMFHVRVFMLGRLLGIEDRSEPRAFEPILAQLDADATTHIGTAIRVQAQR